MSCDNVITVQELETDKKHSTYYREVITGKAGGAGADIDSATNAVTGQTQTTLPKVLSNVGFSPAGFDFTTGGTLTERDKAIFYQADGNWYSWGGTLPKVVPTASSPASTGGIADNAWNVSTSAFMYRDFEGFTAELLAQGGVPDNGQPDEIGNSKRVDAIINVAGRTFKTVAEMKAATGLKVGQRVHWQGYYSAVDGGGNCGVVRTGTHVEDGGSIFSVDTNIYIEANLKGSSVNAAKFGVVGDFDPDTGVGTDDRIAMQACFDFVTSSDLSSTVKLPSGAKIYTGTGYSGLVNVALRFGHVEMKSKNKNIDFNGAEIYQGAEGRCLSIVNIDTCRLDSPRIFGYVGGSIGAWRENDACLSVSYGCNNVTINRAYLTNSLGDQLNIGGSHVNGGELGFTARNIKVLNSTIKERHGNGVKSFEGGTASRLAVAIIDADNVIFSNNTVIGGVDLEPNLNGQSMIDVMVENNVFSSGHVTPQAVIGAKYWLDEPMNVSDGVEITQFVTVTGVAATPNVIGNTIRNNNFDKGYISSYGIYTCKSISGNKFKVGTIFYGSTSGTNYNADADISFNKCESTTDGYSSFIVLDGNVVFSTFIGNESIGCACIGLATTGADAGRNTFSLNKVKRGNFDAINFQINDTSIETGSTNTDGGSGRSYSKSSSASIKTLITPISVINLSSGFAGSIAVVSSTILVNQPAGTVVSITGLNGQAIDGLCVKIQFTPSGGGACSLINGAGFQLKGGVNANAPLNSIFEFMFRAGVWFEVSRNF